MHSAQDRNGRIPVFKLYTILTSSSWALKPDVLADTGGFRGGSLGRPTVFGMDEKRIETNNQDIVKE